MSSISSIAHYSGYPSHPPQQPPLQPNPQYTNPPPYTHYGYPAAGVPSQSPASSSMNTAMVPQAIHLPAMSSAVPRDSMPGSQNYQQHQFDHTGQVAPPGMKPRVTATLWEDEGSLCFQVEAKGVCVARREDNHMINGTKLLNVAGMTRGRRDGILKSEKTRHVVKIGPMHLKGVWIPFERALEFANKEKITESLYPLFVHDIGALLYHPANQSRASVGGAAMAAVERNRRPDPMQGQRYLNGPATSQPQSLHHHHSMSTPIGTPMAQQPPHAIQPHPSSSRPSMDRSASYPNSTYTMPTPPTSATSMIGMGNQGGAHDWNGGSSFQSVPGGQGLSIDTGLSGGRSVPTTPASTPPGNVPQGIYTTAQSYDSGRSLYSAPPSQPVQYHQQQQPQMVYRTEGAYPKSEMAPPARAGEHGDVKPPTDGMLQQDNEQANHVQGEDENHHDNESEYTHTSAPYNTARSSYPYGSSTAPGPLHGEHGHPSPQMAGSPHQNGSSQQTPRTTATGQGQWTTPYNSQRQTQMSNVYNVMSNDTRASSANGNGSAPPESYPPPGAVAQYASQSYAPTNGVPASAKRGRDRDEDEQDGYSRSDGVQGDDIDGLKRRKTMEGGAVGGTTYRDPNPGIQRARTTATARTARR